MKLPEIRLMTDEELEAEIKRLSQRVFDAKNAVCVLNEQALDVRRKHKDLQTHVNKCRDEWSRVREDVKKFRINLFNCLNFVSLVRLYDRTRRKYRNALLESLKTLKEGIELIAKKNQAYKEYRLMEAECEYLQIMWERRETACRWEKGNARMREILSDYALELEAEMYRKGEKLAKLREELS